MIYPCKPGGTDDYIAVVLAGDSWDTILALADRADLIGDPRYSTPEARRRTRRRGGAISSPHGRALSPSTKPCRSLTELGIAAGAVQDSCEVLQDTASQGPRDGHRHPGPRPRRLPDNRLPHQSRGQRCASNAPPPLLGEHSEEVLDHHARHDRQRGLDSARRWRCLGSDSSVQSAAAGIASAGCGNGMDSGLRRAASCSTGAQRPGSVLPASRTLGSRLISPQLGAVCIGCDNTHHRDSVYVRLLAVWVIPRMTVPRALSSHPPRAIILMVWIPTSLRVGFREQRFRIAADSPGCEP